MKRPDTPELDRMVAVSEESQKIGAFLEWLEGEEIMLARYRGDQLVPYSGGGINPLLARYFGIDLDKVERERRAILEYTREQQG